MSEQSMPLVHDAMEGHLAWPRPIGFAAAVMLGRQPMPLLHGTMGAHLAWALHQLSLLQQ
jgi:hypothetical protein